MTLSIENVNKTTEDERVTEANILGRIKCPAVLREAVAAGMWPAATPGVQRSNFKANFGGGDRIQPTLAALVTEAGKVDPRRKESMEKAGWTFVPATDLLRLVVVEVEKK